MRCLILVLLTCSNISLAQQTDRSLKQKAYYVFINSIITHSVDEVRANDIEIENKVWLDARTEEEFAVSRIGNARFVGYDDFDISSVSDLDKSSDIVVYCSIGYRSEKIAEKLEKTGFTKVKNLYGGVFDWYNTGKPVLDSAGNETNKIHGFGRTWGIWLNDAETVY